MSDVFKLAKKGVRVQGAKPQDLIIDSDHPNPKISVLANPPHAGNIFVNWQTTTPIPQGTVQIIYSFGHGFDYIPTTFATYNYNDGSRNITASLPLQVGAIGVITMDADITNINLKYFSFDGVTNLPQFLLTVKFYVLVEPGR